MLDIPYNERNNKIYCYGSYDLQEVYKHVNKIMFACDFFNLPHIEDYANQTCEYCMLEFINNGIIPVLDYDFGKTCNMLENAELSKTSMYAANMGVYLAKDLSNIDAFMHTINDLANNGALYDQFRDECFESWKKHSDPKAIITKLISDICS